MKKLLMLMVLGLPNLINAAYVIIDNQSDDEIKARGRSPYKDISTKIKPHSQGHLESAYKIFQVIITTVRRPTNSRYAATSETIDGKGFNPINPNNTKHLIADNYTIIVTRDNDTYDLKIK